MTDPQQKKEMHFEVQGHAGIITIDRAHALNAITYDMVLDLRQHLIDWRNDDAIRHVVIKAVRGRAFSAGGDIRKLYEQGQTKDPAQIQFFRDEYPLNCMIKHYPKPYIALVDGIAMGGGVGISFNGSHRLGTQNMSFAMPEVGIGFFPDVGATYFLPRLPGAIGFYLGLTGQRIKQADALYTGLITHAIEADDLEAIENSLCDTSLDATLEAYSKPVDKAPALTLEAIINETFGADSLETIFERLGGIASSNRPEADWAQKTLQTLNQKSPTSLAVAFEQLTRGATLDFDDCMRMEFRIVSRILAGHEFYEGVRATIIEKDGAPKWAPAHLNDIASEDIAPYFEPAPGGDLEIR